MELKTQRVISSALLLERGKTHAKSAKGLYSKGLMC